MYIFRSFCDDYLLQFNISYVVVEDKYVNLLMLSKKEEFIESLGLFATSCYRTWKAACFFKNTVFIGKLVDGEESYGKFT